MIKKFNIIILFALSVLVSINGCQRKIYTERDIKTFEQNPYKDPYLGFAADAGHFLMTLRDNGTLPGFQKGEPGRFESEKIKVGDEYVMPFHMTVVREIEKFTHDPEKKDQPVYEIKTTPAAYKEFSMGKSLSYPVSIAFKAVKGNEQAYYWYVVGKKSRNEPMILEKAYKTDYEGEMIIQWIK